METDDNQLFEIMKEFDEYVKEFTLSASAQVPPLDSTVEDLLGLGYDDLLSLTSQQCLAHAFKISGYALYIRSQLNENQARLNWCEDYLNRILAKEWDQYDPYMKYDLKRQAIISQNEFSTKLEKLRSRLKARVTILEDKLKDIRDMAQTLNELGRKKSYEHS